MIDTFVQLIKLQTVVKELAVIVNSQQVYIDNDLNSRLTLSPHYFLTLNHDTGDKHGQFWCRTSAEWKLQQATAETVDKGQNGHWSSGKYCTTNVYLLFVKKVRCYSRLDGFVLQVMCLQWGAMVIMFLKEAENWQRVVELVLSWKEKQILERSVVFERKCQQERPLKSVVSGDV